MDAQDAIDNMDMNEFRGRVLKVSIAKPQKIPLQGLGNKPSMHYLTRNLSSTYLILSPPVWESEEWLQTYGQHGKGDGGVQAKSNKESEEGNEGNEE